MDGETDEVSPIQLHENESESNDTEGIEAKQNNETISSEITNGELQPEESEGSGAPIVIVIVTTILLLLLVAIIATCLIYKRKKNQTKYTHEKQVTPLLNQEDIISKAW